MELNDLVSIPDITIYGFINDETKKCQLFFSTHTLTSLPRHVSEYKFIITNDQLNIKIIETLGPDSDPRLRLTYWNDYYHKLGYQFYKPARGIKYTLKTDFVQYGPSRAWVFIAYLQNRLGQKIIVGAFKRYQEMQSFIKVNYPTKQVYDVISDNSPFTEEVRKYYES